MAQVLLRPAVDGDESLLYGIYASSRTEELAPAGWDDATLEAFLRMQHAAQDRSFRAGHPDASRDVIVIAGDDAGRLYVDRSRPAIHVIDIALLPDYRGQGAGTRLLQALLEEAGCAQRRVTLNVERGNRVRRLYERLGFHVLRDGGVYLDLEWVPPPAPSPPGAPAR